MYTYNVIYDLQTTIPAGINEVTSIYFHIEIENFDFFQ